MSWYLEPDDQQGESKRHGVIEVRVLGSEVSLLISVPAP